MRDQADTRILLGLLADKHGFLRAREILSVWAGLKTARVGVAPDELASITEIVEALGLSWCRSSRKILGKRDVGKGGWSNKFGRSYPADAPLGDWLLYIARSAAIAETARAAEEEDREFDFGGSLGIPPCCARFYLRHQRAAQAKQNDYVPFVLENTAPSPPYDFRLNYVAQYFGYSLISFFPCSFVCAAAAQVAQTSLELLQSYIPHGASETIRLQRSPILYTEYRGLYLFESAWWDGDRSVLHYDPTAIRGTLAPHRSVFRKLKSGRALRVKSKNSVVVEHEDELVAALRGENVSICIF